MAAQKMPIMHTCMAGCVLNNHAFGITIAGHVWGAMVVPWADMVQYISNMSCKCSNITKSPIVVRVRLVRVRVRVRVGG